MFLRTGFILPCVSLAVALLASCGDSDEVIHPVSRPVELLELDCMKDGGVDSLTHTIECAYPKNAENTVKVKKFEFSGDYSAYVVVGDDLEDPELDWAMPVETGAKIPVPDTGALAFAILDGKDRVVDVWKVVFVAEKSSSSKKSSSSSAKSGSSSSKKSSSSSVKSESSSSGKPSSSSVKSESSSSEKSSNSSAKSESSSSTKKSSSSSTKSGSSSSDKSSSSSAKPGSSSSEKSSSSSAKPESSSSEKPTSSSSAKPETSSSEELSSSSVIEVPTNDPPIIVVGPPSSSSSEQAVLLSDFAVDVQNSSVRVEGNKVYVEVPYGSNLKALRVLPMDTVANLERPVEMKFVDDLGVLNDYTVVAGMQLPGTTFDARDYSGFWATTSDAMENTVTEATIKIKSEANLAFGSSQMTISTKEVSGSWIGIEGSWKMAGGFYFAGMYDGTSAIDIYQQGYSSGTPSTGASDISKDMTFGKPFSARPTGFDVTYSYSHVKNSNSTYPQKSLIYVMLVSSDNKVVASGVVTDNSSVGMHKVHVDLAYGSDSGLLSSNYPVASGLSVGTGDENVATIHVMFASSAYAFIVDGGMLGNSDRYRGGENSKLVVDDFKLVY
ncbi:MAG: PCMD domain-containing protein [Fibrobacter sp.]|nr:PCMD domain-containing protein [Fibrobacter sp.]